MQTYLYSTEKGLLFEKENNLNIRNMYLKGIKENIQFPSNVRVRYTNDSSRGFWLDSDKLGAIVSNKNIKNNTHDFIIDFIEGEGDLYKFILGHEEGHITEFTGNLMTLWNSARKLGCDFNFFTEDFAYFSDKAYKGLFQGYWTKKNFSLSLGKTKNTQEILAHIGGLIALKKSGKDSELIDKIEHAIKTRKYPNVNALILEKYNLENKKPNSKMQELGFEPR